MIYPNNNPLVGGHVADNRLISAGDLADMAFHLVPGLQQDHWAPIRDYAYRGDIPLPGVYGSAAFPNPNVIMVFMDQVVAFIELTDSSVYSQDAQGNYNYVGHWSDPSKDLYVYEFGSNLPVSGKMDNFISDDDHTHYGERVNVDYIALKLGNNYYKLNTTLMDTSIYKIKSGVLYPIYAIQLENEDIPEGALNLTRTFVSSCEEWDYHNPEPSHLYRDCEFLFYDIGSFSLPKTLGYRVYNYTKCFMLAYYEDGNNVPHITIRSSNSANGEYWAHSLTVSNNVRLDTLGEYDQDFTWPLELYNVHYEIIGD